MISRVYSLEIEILKCIYVFNEIFEITEITVISMKSNSFEILYRIFWSRVGSDGPFALKESSAILKMLE